MVELGSGFLNRDSIRFYYIGFMNKSLVCWIIILLASLSSCTSKTADKEAQAKNDSIKKYLDLAGNDTIAFDKRIKYNDKAYSLIDFNRNDTLTRYNLYNISFRYWILNKNLKLKLTAEKLMLLSLNDGDSLNLGKAYRNLGLYYMSISNNEKAIAYFFKAKKIFKSIQKKVYILKVMGDISLAQAYASDFLGSNKTVTEMLALSKKSNYKKLDFFCYVKIGNNLNFLKNDVEAINYLKIAEKISSSKSDNISLYNNLSDSYINLKQYDTALKYVNLNLNNSKLLSYEPSSYSRSLSLSAYIQLKKRKYFNLEKKFNLADDYFRRYNSPSGRNYNQIYLSEYYSKVKDTLNAIKAANRAVSISKSFKNPADILLSLEQLIKVDKKNASTNAQEYIRVNDSMQIVERNFRDKFARIAYETDEISQEKEKAIHQKWIVTAIATAVILFVLLILIITRQRAKQKELQLLQEQQKANEEIYHLMLTQKAKEDEAKKIEKKRIARELHDGIMNKLSSTRLNLSILANKTDKETIQKCLAYVNEITQIETDIRTISHDLNQDIFQKEDSYTKMLEDFVNEQNKTSKTHYELELDRNIDWNTVSSEIKMHLYRIIQEASHNINKYAQAKKAIISLILDKPNICMAITDNGIGFDTSIPSKGIGLQNMQARVKSLNGKFNISSKRRANTSVNIAIPIQ